MQLPGPLLGSILSHAQEGYPLEVCGVLLGGRVRGARSVEEVVPIPNREVQSPEVRYQIAPEDLIRVQRRAREMGRDILGFYHSHPDHPARPSPTDRELAAQGMSDGVVHLIVAVEAGRVIETTAWVYEEARGDFVEEALE